MLSNMQRVNETKTIRNIEIGSVRKAFAHQCYGYCSTLAFSTSKNPHTTDSWMNLVYVWFVCVKQTIASFKSTRPTKNSKEDEKNKINNWNWIQSSQCRKTNYFMNGVQFKQCLHLFEIDILLL